ncbi:hypothetical protein [Treponema sp.]|uniref:hypothetical protein n=1 Tax=Treponema sp. TaxID=166 RepID=UPI00388F8C6B
MFEIKKCIKAVALSCLATFIMSCSPSVETVYVGVEEPSYASITLEKDGDAETRTALTNIDFEDFTYFALKGSFQGGEEKQIRSWTSIEKLTGDKVAIDKRGSWTFTFIASKGNTVYTGSTSKTIVSGNNSLHFVLYQSEYDNTGSGNLSYTMYYAVNNVVQQVVAEISDLNGKSMEDFTNVFDMEKDFQVAPRGYLGLKYENSLPSGYYFINFIFYADIEKTIVLNTYSEVIHIENGLSTVKTAYLSNFNKPNNADITVTMPEEEDVKISVTRDGSLYYLKATKGFDSYKWIVDGVVLESTDHEAVYDATNIEEDYYSDVTVIAMKNNVPYSDSTQIKINIIPKTIKIVQEPCELGIMLHIVNPDGTPYERLYYEDRDCMASFLYIRINGENVYQDTVIPDFYFPYVEPGKEITISVMEEVETIDKVTMFRTEVRPNGYDEIKVTPTTGLGEVYVTSGIEFTADENGTVSITKAPSLNKNVDYNVVFDFARGDNWETGAWYSHFRMNKDELDSIRNLYVEDPSDYKNNGKGYTKGFVDPYIVYFYTDNEGKRWGYRIDNDDELEPMRNHSLKGRSEVIKEEPLSSENFRYVLGKWKDTYEFEGQVTLGFPGEPLFYLNMISTTVYHVTINGDGTIISESEEIGYKEDKSDFTPEESRHFQYVDGNKYINRYWKKYDLFESEVYRVRYLEGIYSQLDGYTKITDDESLQYVKISELSDIKRAYTFNDSIKEKYVDYFSDEPMKVLCETSAVLEAKMGSLFQDAVWTYSKIDGTAFTDEEIEYSEKYAATVCEGNERMYIPCNVGYDLEEVNVFRSIYDDILLFNGDIYR